MDIIYLNKWAQATVGTPRQTQDDYATFVSASLLVFAVSGFYFLYDFSGLSNLAITDLVEVFKISILFGIQWNWNILQKITIN